MKNSIKHICDIKCPKCHHKYTNEKVSNDNLFEFLTYLICKNPLCNYDIEIKGETNLNSSNNIDSIRIISIK